jgi:hypothetical protein
MIEHSKVSEMMVSNTSESDERKLKMFGPINYGNTPLGRTMSRWVENVNMDFQETAWKCVDCSHLAQYGQQRACFVKMVKHLLIYISKYRDDYAAQYIDAYSAHCIDIRVCASHYTDVYALQSIDVYHNILMYKLQDM